MLSVSLLTLSGHFHYRSAFADLRVRFVIGERRGGVERSVTVVFYFQQLLILFI